MSDVVGRKDDAGKPRMDLLGWDALERVAEVMTFGAEKYEERNYYGLAQSRLFAAAMRHLSAYWNGRDFDEETNFLHLAHAACCVLMLLEKDINELGEDDRPDKPADQDDEPTMCTHGITNCRECRV